MNIIDIVILIIILFGFLLGFKRGFTKEIVCLFGMIVVLLLSYILRSPVSTFLCNTFPFFSFNGITALNILLYDTIAFFLVFIVLMILLKILMHATTLFEKLLNMTIVLGLVSKVLGGILGAIKNYVIVFLMLFVLSLPIFKLEILSNSKLCNSILDKTPVLNIMIEKSIDTFNEFKELNKSKDSKNTNEFNNNVLKLLIKNKIITKDNIQKLIENKKIIKN